MPELRRLAYEGDDSWVYAYDERLAARSLTAERVTLWTSVANRPGAPVDYRRGAAARLAELGAVAEAAGVLETLAATAAPDDPDVLQLVSLSGATPGPESISWLESRLRSAAPADQPGWMDHLVRAGAARSVVSAIPRLPDAASSTFVASWIAAHESIDEPLTLRAALQQLLLQRTRRACSQRSSWDHGNWCCRR